MADLRFALRRLAASPGFTLLAVVLLAVGIGANAVIYGALDTILLRTLPARHPEQLARLVQDLPRLGKRSTFSYAYYRELRLHATTLSAVFGQEPMEVAMGRPAPAEEVQVHLVTPEYFEALDAAALAGRTLVAKDAAESAGAPPAVLSYGFWRRRFRGDRAALGHTIELHGHAFLIVGVMPRDFKGISIETAPDVWTPLRAAPLLQLSPKYEPIETRWTEISLRMKPGVTRERAQAECQALWSGNKAGFGGDDTKPLELDPLEHGVSLLRDRFSGALRLLIASVGLLQLLVCANLAGLLLARGARRRPEIAIRVAMGASRGRIVRLMLMESAILTAAGAVGGVALASFTAPLLEHGLPPVRDVLTTRLSLAVDFAPNASVLLYSLAISALTALFFGIVPALAAARVNLDSVLRGARSAGGWKGRQLLLVLQIALCTTLLAGAGLLVRSFHQLRDTNPGFAGAHVVSFTLNPSLSGYKKEQVKALRDALIARVRNLPGVDDVAAASRGLLRGSGVKTSIAPEGQIPTQADFLNASLNNVTPGYFETIGTPLLAGHDLRAEDIGARQPEPVVVNQALARKFFPGENPIGRRLGNRIGQSGAAFEIVGVVGDARYRSLREPLHPTLFSTLTDDEDFTLYVRTAAHPESLIQPVRQALASIDPALPVAEVHLLAEELDASAAPERLTATMASIFALVAALLAAVGLYGLLSYAVAQRQREIGIRIALGARPGAIARLIGGHALLLAAAGVVLGIGGALLAAPLAGSLLYGIAPSDPASLLAAALFVATIAALAAILPAVRAARVDPATALRD